MCTANMRISTRNTPSKYAYRNILPRLKIVLLNLRSPFLELIVFCNCPRIRLAKRSYACAFLQDRLSCTGIFIFISKKTFVPLPMTAFENTPGVTTLRLRTTVPRHKEEITEGTAYQGAWQRRRRWCRRTGWRSTPRGGRRPASIEC